MLNTLWLAMWLKPKKKPKQLVPQIQSQKNISLRLAGAHMCIYERRRRIQKALEKSCV